MNDFRIEIGVFISAKNSHPFVSVEVNQGPNYHFNQKGKGRKVLDGRHIG